MQCPVCTAGELSPFYVRENEPAGQSFLMDSAQQALGVPRGTITLSYCSECEFICNTSFDPKLQFDSSYNSVQTHSPAFDAYLSKRAKFLIDECGVNNKHIVDIGCGRGEFTRLLVADPSLGNTVTGFDTVYDGPAEASHGRARFISDYFSKDTVDKPIDVVVCRLTMEYITDPVVFLRSIREALDPSRTVRLFFEVLDCTWTLHSHAYWDVFYERFAYWTPHALATAFRNAGFFVEGVTDSFGKQYFQIEASTTDSTKAKIPKIGVHNAASSFTASADSFRTKWTQHIALLAAKKPVAIWGAAGKGVTFVNMIDPQGSVVTCVVDINPAKEGKFVPGTGHPITCVSGLEKFNIGYAVITNPNYSDEIAEQLCAVGLDEVELVPLL